MDDVRDQQYSAPTVRSLGTVEQLTEQQHFNKIGSATDQYTSNQVPVVGTVVPFP
ncbi:MAG: hypothetical protein QOI80_3134 [Solirubrobacteraceae bacterium]|jgi:hypothetical protein|nr:hypothetical protein [Solirubrobacteraceae bacterium]